MKKGCFITFEGSDGCGKTTQLELTAKYLKEKGFEVLTTREPGAPGLGCELRKILQLCFAKMRVLYVFGGQSPAY